MNYVEHESGIHAKEHLYRCMVQLHSDSLGVLTRGDHRVVALIRRCGQVVGGGAVQTIPIAQALAQVRAALK